MITPRPVLMPLWQPFFSVFHHLALPASMNMQIVSQSQTLAWPAANWTCYVPFVLDRAVTVDQMAWINGSAVTGNLDAGIYTEAGTRLVNSGSVAGSGVSAKQLADVTNTALAKDTLYYMAITRSSTSGRTIWVTTWSAGVAAEHGILEEITGSFGLPATATFAPFTTASRIPVFGFVPLNP